MLCLTSRASPSSSSIIAVSLGAVGGEGARSATAD